MARAHTLQYDVRNGTYFVWIRRDGVSKYFNFGDNKRTAQEKLRRFEADIESGKVQFSSLDTTQQNSPDGKKDIRVEELAEKHMEWVEASRAEGTFDNRKKFLQKFLDFIGETMVSEITRSRLEDFHVWVVKKENKRRGKNGWKLSPNAGFETMRHIRTFLRWGEEMELIELSFRRFPRLSYTQPETRRIDPNDLAILLKHASPEFRDFIVFALLTGLRPLEMRNLMRDNRCYTDDGTPFLFIEKKVKGAKMVRIPKPRSVPLCKEAEAIFERQIKLHPKSKFIFLNFNGIPFTRTALRDRFRRLQKKCGLKGSIIPYGLRHTFASLQAVGGTETTSLAQLMGHSTTRTLQRYVSNTAKEHLEAMEKNEKRVLALLNAGDQTNGQEAETGKKLPPNLPRTLLDKRDQ